jgi:hypothetical protein
VKEPSLPLQGGRLFFAEKPDASSNLKFLRFASQFPG